MSIAFVFRDIAREWRDEPPSTCLGLLTCVRSIHPEPRQRGFVPKGSPAGPHMRRYVKALLVVPDVIYRVARYAMMQRAA